MSDKLLELAVAAGSVEVPETGGHRVPGSICFSESGTIQGNARAGHKRNRNAKDGIAPTSGPEDRSKDPQAFKTPLLGSTRMEIATPPPHWPQPALKAECSPLSDVPASRHQPSRLQQLNPLVFARPSSDEPRPRMPTMTNRGVTSPAAALEIAPRAGCCGNMATHPPVLATTATGITCHNWPRRVIGWSSSCGMYPAARPRGFLPCAKNIASAGGVYAPTCCMYNFAPGTPYAAYPGTVTICHPSPAIAQSSGAGLCAADVVASRNRQPPLVRGATVGGDVIHSSARGEEAAIEEVAESNGPMPTVDDAKAAVAADDGIPRVAERSSVRPDHGLSMPRDDVHAAGGTGAGVASPSPPYLTAAYPATGQGTRRCFRRTTGGASPDSDVARVSEPLTQSPVGAPGDDQQPPQVRDSAQHAHFQTQGGCDNWACVARASMRHQAKLDGWLMTTSPGGADSGDIAPDVKLDGADGGEDMKSIAAARVPVAGWRVTNAAASCCQLHRSRCSGQARAQQDWTLCWHQAARSPALMDTTAGVSTDANRTATCCDDATNGCSSSSPVCARSPGSNGMLCPTGLWATTPPYPRPYPYPYSYPYPYPYRGPSQLSPAYCYRPGCLCSSAYRYRCDYDYGYYGQGYDYIYANGSIMAHRYPCPYGNRRDVLQASGGLTRSLSHPPMSDEPHIRYSVQHRLLHPSLQHEQREAVGIRAGTWVVPLRRNATAPAASLALATSGIPPAPAVHDVKEEAGKAMAVRNAEVVVATATAELTCTSRPGIAATNARAVAGAAATDGSKRKAGDVGDVCRPVGVRPDVAKSSAADDAEQRRRQQQLLLMLWSRLKHPQHPQQQQQHPRQACVREAFSVDGVSIAAAAQGDDSGQPSLPAPTAAGPARPPILAASRPLERPRHLYCAPPALSPTLASRLPPAAIGGESNIMRRNWSNGVAPPKYGTAAAATVSAATARNASEGSIGVATDVHNSVPPAAAGEFLLRHAGLQRAARVEQQQQTSKVCTGPMPTGTSSVADYGTKAITATRRRSRDDMEQGDQDQGPAWDGLNPFQPPPARSHRGGNGGYLKEEEEEERSSERPCKRAPTGMKARLDGI
ncbi:hypothetical protein Vretifemale_3369 [Volvox reticuliferus]|uniref:Uncharacterized protein n=1 Tax=Volvox reticuliferus TaxID=1737510 RepID=A0A8J4C213_9CHLO|nr:hypothetical protein Vretifemale_3369 [Volvox reticuliferus]